MAVAFVGEFTRLEGTMLASSAHSTLRAYKRHGRAQRSRHHQGAPASMGDSQRTGVRQGWLLLVRGGQSLSRTFSGRAKGFRKRRWSRTRKGWRARKTASAPFIFGARLQLVRLLAHARSWAAGASVRSAWQILNPCARTENSDRTWAHSSEPRRVPDGR